MMQTALLEVKNLSFSRSDRVIFRNAAFSLAPKESLGLSGPIGCGKTTLLRILTGLERPQTMSLSLEGVPVTAQKDFQRLRRKVGYVLQNPDDQLFFPEVIEDVMFGPLNLGLSYAQARTLDAWNSKSCRGHLFSALRRAEAVGLHRLHPCDGTRSDSFG